MINRECVYRAMRYEPADRRPLHLVGPWPDTLARWQREGLPEGVDVHAYLGVQDKAITLTNVSPITGVYPYFEERVIEEKDEVVISIDKFGRTIREYKHHTTMPEWIDFPVKTSEDLRRVIDERFSLEYLDERFGGDWEARVRTASARADIVIIDGGCYYGTLRNLAGVEYVSYLFHDVPELVAELIERYFTVVMEGIRRAAKLTKIDAVGFGEDIAYKTSTLISPAMMREFILPKYRAAMNLARECGIELTWYDSDGDVKPFIPDFLTIGITTLAPCEVAAGMAPTDLRKTFGRDLRMIGGIDKREIAKGKASIDAEIERNRPLIEEGGYLPAIDHSISADISFDNYRYFLDRLLPVLGY